MAKQFGGFTEEQKEVLARRMGFKGPMDQFGTFLQSSPAHQQKFLSYEQKARHMVEAGSAPQIKPQAQMSLGGLITNAANRTLTPVTNTQTPSRTLLQTTPSRTTAQTLVQTPSRTTTQTPSRTTPNRSGLAPGLAATLNPRPAPTTPTTPTTPPPPPTPTLANTNSQEGVRTTREMLANAENFTPQTEVTPMSTSSNEFVSSSSGQVAANPNVNVAQTGPTAQAGNVTATPARTVTTATSEPAVASATENMEAAQGQVSNNSLVNAQQQATSSVSSLEAAQGQAYLMNNPIQREIQQGELISGSAVDAQKVEQLNASLQAAQATPSKQATVQGQLEGLMQQFEGGQTPAWAAGAMRAASAALAARGLSASSMAGQAVVQAAMESALPIAQADANTRAQFEAQNLSNRQQVAMFGAQQRAAFLQQEFDQAFQTRVLNAAKIADVANMNFTAEQQIALENSRAVNTMNLANLDARQGMVMAEAAALANLDLANLNNRQQAAVQNAQAFLQMDMQNLDNRQQMEVFKNQSIIQSLFNDQAAENASRQFNATSQAQTDQFFAQLRSQTQQFNAAQTNAMRQFNAGQTNSVNMFNRQMNDARDQFNASNRLIIDQSNAEWRRAVTTANNATINEANRTNAMNATNMTMAAYNNLMQRERDMYTFAFTAGENSRNRASELAIAQLSANTARANAKDARSADMWGAVGGLVAAWLD